MAIGNIVCCCLWEWLVVGLVVTPWILRQQGAKRSKDAFIRGKFGSVRY